MSQSRGAESAHTDHTVWSDRKREVGALAQSAKCAAVPIRHLRQVKTLITSACLKNCNFLNIDNRIEMYVSNCCSHETLLHDRTRSFGIDYHMSNC